MLKPALDFRPDTREFFADPYPIYRRLREEDPVHWSPRLRAWVLTRYDDVKRVLLDRELSVVRMRPHFAALPGPEAARVAEILKSLATWMVFRDPPHHTHLRRLTSKVLTAQSMQAMRPTVAALTDLLLAEIGEREHIDFVADFAGPLPALVIMAMLGIPRDRLLTVKRLSDEIALLVGASHMSAQKYAIAERATQEMAAYLRELIQARRTEPGTDLLSQLVHVEDAGERLTDDELVATCMLLVFAGHETTTNHLANGLLALLAFPGEQAALRADPGLAPSAVEELLRYDGPSGVQSRTVLVEQQLRGQTLAVGDRVYVMLSAANRDPEAYPDPDRLDLQRDGVPQLSFGFGMHMCLGFPLARLEGQIALPAVLARWRRIELALPEAELDWQESMVFRGMRRMPLSVAR